ncbi:MAG: toll/interleukin-1 receptor domain-containing protein [Bryobacteraceae bacterium]
MGGHVFISHSSRDREHVEYLCDVLERNGYSCWFAPRDVGSAGDWAGEVVTAIKHCRVFLLVLSRHSNQSEEVERELHQLKRKPLVVVRVDAVEPSETLSYFARSSQWLDQFALPGEEFQARLLEAIGNPQRRGSKPLNVLLLWLNRAGSASRAAIWIGAFAALLTFLTKAFLDGFTPPGTEPLRGGALGIVFAFWTCCAWGLDGVRRVWNTGRAKREGR